MLKIFAIIFLIVAFAGCMENHSPAPENDYEFTVEYDLNDESYENGSGLVPPEPPTDIPRYNEYRVSLQIIPDERRVLGLSTIIVTNRTGAKLETIQLRTDLNAFREDAEHPPVFEELEWRAFPNEREYGFMNIEYAFLDTEPLEFLLDETVLTLYLPAPLEPYATVTLQLQYSAYIPQISHRTGANAYAMWFGKFLPVLSHETSNFQVEIITPARFQVVGTGLRTSEVIGNTDTKITHFVAHQVRDFAFAVSPNFNHASTATESGITIHFYYYTNSSRPDEVLYAARRSVEYFETNVGIYPFGQITLIETSLLQDSKFFSHVIFLDSRYLDRAVRYWALTHAIGNLWFASVVGTDRANEPWLTNGLTRFVQAGLFYDSETFRTRAEHDHASITDQENLYISRGLSASETQIHYIHTHGRKAMLMVYALYSRIGNENFWNLIAEYYQRFSFSFATTADFINLAEEISAQDLSAFFDEWLNSGTVPDLP